MAKSINFEKSLLELESIVKDLEQGELGLENSLKQFEKGMSYVRKCQEILTEAEQKIEIITATNTSLTDDK